MANLLTLAIIFINASYAVGIAMVVLHRYLPEWVNQIIALTMCATMVTGTIVCVYIVTTAL